jgi:undecaprenyl-diphosphatase
LDLGPSPSPAPELVSLLALAVIQGVSEFLPISSDGHLVLAQHFMGLTGPHLAIDVALHLGTLAAVGVVFWRDLLGLLRHARSEGGRELALLVLGSLPLAIVGLGFRDQIESLFSSGRAAALGLLGTAGFLWVGERARRLSLRRPRAEARALDWRDAVWIGSAQALAILPGVSRSGTTIATALARGTEATAAARFSFLLSVPAVSGAVLLEVPQLVRSGGFGPELAWAVLLTFVVGVVALRFLLAFLGRGAFRWCALYCVTVGGAALFVV